MFFSKNTPPRLRRALQRGLAVVACGLGLATATLPAADYAVTTTGGILTITDLAGGSDTLAVSEPAPGQIKFAAAARTFSVDGGPDLPADSGQIPLAGITRIIIHQTTGTNTATFTAFTSLPSLEINGGSGDDTITFNGSIPFAADATLLADLQDDAATPGADTFTLAPAAQLTLTGTGTATVRVSKNIRVSANARLTVQHGDMILEANLQPTQTPGAYPGICLNTTNYTGSGSQTGIALQSTGSGNVTLRARGGTGTTGFQDGVQVTGLIRGGTAGSLLRIEGWGGQMGSGDPSSGISVAALVTTNGGNVELAGIGNPGVNFFNAQVTTGGTGTVTVQGTGNTIGGTGMVLHNQPQSSLPPAQVPANITSGGGDVRVIGQGTGGGTGIYLHHAGKISAPGTAKIYVNGTGSPTWTADSAYGVYASSGIISSSGGDVEIIGTGGGTAGAWANYGVYFGGLVNGPDAAHKLTITGTGGSGTGGSNYGVALTNYSTTQPDVVTTSGGPIYITGIAGQGNSLGVTSVGGASASAYVRTSTYGGNIYLTCDKLELTNLNLKFEAAASSKLILRTLTPGRRITLGPETNTATDALELSYYDLRALGLKNLQIGDSATGAINTNGTAWFLPGFTNVVFTLAGTYLSPAASGVDFNLISYLNSSYIAQLRLPELRLAINGTVADTGYTRLNVQGGVNLTDAALSLEGTHVPVPGQVFTIVENDGTDAIVGTFNNLPAGSVLAFNGVPLAISYTGGSGNDVTLTALAGPAPAPVIAIEQPVGNPLAAGADIVWPETNIARPETLAFTLRNTAAPGNTLNVQRIASLGANADEFIVNTTALTGTLDGGQSTTFTVTFAPTAAGTRTSTLRIVTNDPAQPVLTFNLSGTVHPGPNNITFSTASIAENQPIGTQLGTLTATALDPALTAGITLSLVSGAGDTDNGKFTLVGDTLVSTAPLDFEETPVCSFRIRATDSAGFYFEKALTFALVNLLDEPGQNDFPYFTKGANLTLSNGASNPSVFTSWATSIDDGDSDFVQTLTFTIAEIGNSGIFASPPSITADGTLTTPPCTGYGTATFRVTLTDDDTAGSPARTTAEQTFTVTVTPPDFQVTLVGGVLTVKSNVTNSTVGINLSEPAPGFIRVQSSSRTFSFNYGAFTTSASSDISLAGVTAIVVNGYTAHDTFSVGTFTTPMPNLTFNGGTGHDTLTFSGPLTFAPNASFSADLQKDALSNEIETATFAANALLTFSGTGSATVKVSSAITIPAGAGIVVENGPLIVEACQQGSPSFIPTTGLNLTGSLRSTGTGNVSIKARGGMGLSVTGGGKIQGGLAGSTLNVAGTGNIGTQVRDNLEAITSLGANVVVSGTHPTSSSSPAFSITNGGGITAGGVGTVSITASGSSSSASGLSIEGTVAAPSRITSSGGVINVTATNGTYYLGLRCGTAAAPYASITTAENGGDIFLNLNGISINNTISSITTQVMGKVQIQGTAVSLGPTTEINAATCISQAELDRIITGEIRITNTSSVNISAPITPAPATKLRLQPSNYITLSGTGSLISSGDQITIDPGIYLSSTSTAAELNYGTAPVSLGSAGDDLRVTLNGTTPETQHTRYDLIGTVNLTGLDFLLAGTLVPAEGQTFTVLTNDGTDPIIGNFNGLPEAALIKNIFTTTIYHARISYTGGDGNDVTLTIIRDKAPTDILLTPVSTAENQPSGSPIATLTGTDPNPGDAATLVFALVPGAGSADNAAFTVDGTTLRSAAVFDYETKSTYQIRLRTTDVSGQFLEKAVTITITDLDESPLGLWRTAHFGNATANTAHLDDFDHDGINNLSEFAFGLDPTCGHCGALTLDGATLLNPGLPQAVSIAGQPCAIFIRRADHTAAGLTYTALFTADLATWEPSAATPLVLAASGNLQAVCLPFPTLTTGQPATIFRIQVTVTP